MRLSSCVALVTGGTRGIGASIARLLAQEGAQIIVCSRHAPADSNTNIDHFACDVRDADQVQRLMAHIMAKFGRLDIVVNNAGGAPQAQAATSSPRFAERVIALNLLAPLYVSQAAYAIMSEQPSGGSIINIASVAGTRAAPLSAAYGAAKAGLLSLTRSLAQEWGGKNIRVNAVIVGLAQTDDISSSYGNAAAQAEIAQSLPLGRMATGDDVARAVLFLASPDAAYISGAELAVHGGGETPLFMDIVARHQP